MARRKAPAVSGKEADTITDCAFRRASPSSPGRVTRRGKENACLNPFTLPAMRLARELRSREIAAESPLPGGARVTTCS